MAYIVRVGGVMIFDIPKYVLIFGRCAFVGCSSKTKFAGKKYQYSSHSDNRCVELHGCMMSKWKCVTQKAAKARQRLKSKYMSYCKRENVKPKMFLPVGRGVVEEQSLPVMKCSDDVACLFFLISW